jgi:2-oxo-4-hydroxy-4-carboxy-5-ureidoimidazoline decarboxylase
MVTTAGLGGAAGSLQRFNTLPAGAARRELLTCCVSAAWADPLVAGRPYPSLAALATRSDAAVAAMTAADLAAALAGHPRIGERRAAQGADDHDARSAGWSRQEQSGVDGADGETSRALADGNAAYERRFGHIYLVCAAGRSAAELLALLRARLGNDPAAEWLVVRGELQKINQLRLRKLLADPA